MLSQFQTAFRQIQTFVAFAALELHRFALSDKNSPQAREELLRSTLKRFPHYAPAHYELAGLARAQGNLELLLSELRALELLWGTDDTRCKALKAEYLLSVGQFQASVAAFSELESSEFNKESLAAAHMGLGDFQAALRLLESVPELSPEAKTALTVCRDRLSA